MAKFTPLHDRILVRRIEEGETTRGGIIIPDSAKEKPQEGEVISAGKGKITEEGKVRDVTVSGDATAGAVKAIRAFLATCSYQPATQNGKPVAVKWKGELRFPSH